MRGWMMVKAAPLAAALLLPLLLAAPVLAQVTPLAVPGQPAQGAGVEPAPPLARPGEVQPLPIGDTSDERVIAEGRAPIHGGDVDKARRAALRVAYAEAVSRVCGVEIGSMTLVRNVRKVSDLVMARSRGFVKRYGVMREGVSPADPGVYEVVIEAEVVAAGSTRDQEKEGLRLYLELLDNPRLLIMLPGERVAPAGTAGSSTQVKVEAGGAKVSIAQSQSATAGAAAPPTGRTWARSSAAARRPWPAPSPTSATRSSPPTTCWPRAWPSPRSWPRPSGG